MDINKVVRQHLEMEQFFSGFAVKGKAQEPQDQESEQNREDLMAVAEKAKEMENIAGQVNQCRQCDLGSLRTNAVPGEPLPAFDTTLFIINALIVFLSGVIATVATKGQLGYIAVNEE